MKLLVVLFCFVALLTGCFTNWTKADVYRQATWTALHGADWLQTRYIAQHPEQYKEYNPILGSHPSVTEVDLYMGGWMVLHPIITDILPPEYRKYWQYITIGEKAFWVGHNYSIGIGFGW